MTERQPDNGEKSVSSRHSPSKIRVNSLFLNCKFCDNPVTLETVGLDRKNRPKTVCVCCDKCEHDFLWESTKR